MITESDAKKIVQLCANLSNHRKMLADLGAYGYKPRRIVSVNIKPVTGNVTPSSYSTDRVEISSSSIKIAEIVRKALIEQYRYYEDLAIFELRSMGAEIPPNQYKENSSA